MSRTAGLLACLCAVVLLPGAFSQSLSALGAICSGSLAPQLRVFCRVARNATSDPMVAMLNNRTASFTVFPFTDRGIQNTRFLMSRYMSVTLDQLYASPALCAIMIKAHLVPGIVSDTRTWRRDVTTFTNALGQQLLVSEGRRMSLYIDGPRGSVKVMQRNVVGGNARLQIMEWPLYPDLD